MKRRSAEVGLLVGEVVHSLNNPATYLLTNLSTLVGDPEFIRDDPDEVQEMLDECVEGVRRVVEIAKELRAYVAMDAESDPEGGVDLEDVVYSAVRVARYRFGEQVTVALKSAVAVEIDGDTDTIARLVLDVVLHAASNLRGQVQPAPAIDVSLVLDGEHAVVEVGDNGAAQLLAGEPGARGEALALDDRRWSDLGLGVSLHSVRRFGGSLRLVQRAPRGSAVQILLPS